MWPHATNIVQWRPSYFTANFHANETFQYLSFISLVYARLNYLKVSRSSFNYFFIACVYKLFPLDFSNSWSSVTVLVTLTPNLNFTPCAFLVAFRRCIYILWRTFLFVSYILVNFHFYGMLILFQKHIYPVSQDHIY